MITKIEELYVLARQKPMVKIAIVCAHNKRLLQIAMEAKKANLAEVVLVGDKQKMTDYFLDIEEEFAVYNSKGEHEACGLAFSLLNEGRIDGIMSGDIEPQLFVDEVKKFLSTSSSSVFLNHIGLFEISELNRIIFVTDAAVNIAPKLSEKVEILNNTIKFAHLLGLKEPKVAIITPIEKVNYLHMPSTMDAAVLAKMSSVGQIKGAVVDGPLALDNAISLRAAQIKNINSPVAGRADILLLHDIETANILYKILTYFAKAKVAGVIVGADFPIILISRSDPIETGLNSLALARVIASA